jgi:hypothetical protein
MNPADISPCPPTKRLKQTRHYPAAAHQTTRVTRSQKASEPGAYVHPTSILPASVFTPPESLAKGVDSTQNTAQGKIKQTCFYCFIITFTKSDLLLPSIF